jgi:hypothetical protein
MILYKYLSLSAGLAMLENRTLAFTKISSFNDPTEATAAGYKDENLGINGAFWLPRRLMLDESYAICCLTRTARNAIMWAHYGERHQGLVIGIDTNKAQLEENNLCVLPARYGSMIYTASKPNHQYELADSPEIRRGKLKNFNEAYLEALQRAFLHKSSEWAYEEEVRVVKAISSLQSNGIDEQQDLTMSGIYLQKIPASAIYSIHLGFHTLSHGHDDTVALLQRIVSSTPDAALFRCKFANDSWDMEQHSFTNWRRELDEWYAP